MQRTTVPSSRCSFFSDGKTDDSSCRMMEALMYGTMPAGSPYIDCKHAMLAVARTAPLQIQMRHGAVFAAKLAG